MTTLRELVQASPELVSLLDARGVAGERHLLSAWAHLGRARSRGESRLRDRSAEFLLYVAGDHQLPRALAKVGVSETTPQFVIVAERPRSLTELLNRFLLEPDPEAFPRPVSEETLERLGVNPLERAAVPPSVWEGLVLERVALLDLSPPAHAAATAKSS